MNETRGFVLMCKSYRNDLESFRRLFGSVEKHNVDSIRMYVSVPEDDLQIFQEFVNMTVTVISDESYAWKYLSTESYWGLPVGYINQEICKLAFWETGVCKNYLSVDSDSYFIRDFHENDFMMDDKTPYSVLVMDKDLNIERHYKEFGKWRMNLIKKIFDYVGYHDRRFLTCHSTTVLNCAVLEDMKKCLLDEGGIGYKDLIEISPYEYSWYNVWLQKSGVIPVVAVEPFFKMFHMRIEYIFSKVKLITEEDLAEQYVGIVLNSNWKPKKPPKIYGRISWLERAINKFIERL